MESGWRNSFNAGDGGDGTGGGDGDGGGQNGNFIPNSLWDVWEDNGTSNTAVGTRYDWSNQETAAVRAPDSSVFHALLFGSNSIHHRMPDPHMMCLKLGKRHYCENASSSSATKRGKLPPYPYPYPYPNIPDDNNTNTSNGFRTAATSAAVVVPRCQVEGCHVALLNAKEYYRRHKVCEIHSKAPKVVVLGLQQRFCQQCSRFHEITEFDETKRSCRRRLEGHNQRRRKGALSTSIPRNFPHSQSQSHENNPMTEQRLRPSPHSKPGCALSLLSSPKLEPWISSDDLSSRCSAALCELIAANRAISLVGNQNHFQQQLIENTIHSTTPDTQIWDRFNNADDHATMTLDLMQGPALDFGLFSMKEKSKDPEEWTDYCWSAFGGTNVV